jgi:SMI1 / KNR4 family (SUKH-1)
MTTRKRDPHMFPNMHGDTSATITTDLIIDEFEQSRAVRLPTLYRTFLKKTNGGIPDRRIYPITGMHNNPYGGIQCFFGFRKQIEVDTLSWNYDLYAGSFPHGIVPIAGNGGGDYVCLDLRGGRARVAFWNFRHFWGTGEWRESDLYPISDSFEQFLASLTINA